MWTPSNFCVNYAADINRLEILQTMAKQDMV